MSGYIGTQPVPQATQTRQTFTATASQTSFATGGYQAGYLDVFLNGVKLVDGTDYTATNGSDVVLTTGAASGDTLEVVAYTAFEAANVTGATDFTVTGSFTSQGIDDNATSTAMTLDSSGNLLVGTTDATPYNNNAGSTADNGIVLSEAGWLAASRYQGTTAFFNRTGNDGDIAVFRKDGSTVGTIGTWSGTSYIGAGDTGLAFGFGNNDIRPFNPSTVSQRDAAVDLGESGTRFKDLYLSGGVYLGGTGSDNKLDDYEEGTWTPVVQGDSSVGTTTYSVNGQKGGYTKIGNLVSLTFYISWTAMTGTGGLLITGMPFTLSGNTSNDVSAGNCMTSDLDIPNGTNNLTLVGTDGAAFLRIFSSIDAGGIQQVQCDAGGATVWGQFTYRAT